MYIDLKHTCEREFLNGVWQVDHATGLCIAPLCFWYHDIDKRAGIRAFAFDIALFGFSKWGAMPRGNWTPCESVTFDFEPAANASDDFESVTDARVCVVCGETLDGRRSHSVTCSAKCRKAYSRRERQ